MTQLLEYTKLPPIARGLYAAHGVRFLCDGDIPGYSPSGKDALACFIEDEYGNDAIHFPVTGPDSLSTCLHEFAHWTAGRWRRPKIRNYGVPDDLLGEISTKGLEELLNQRIHPYFGHADYIADELIAESFAQEGLRRLNQPADPDSANYINQYLNVPKTPDWFIAIQLKLLRYGRLLAVRFL